MTFTNLIMITSDVFKMAIYIGFLKLFCNKYKKEKPISLAS